MKPHTAVPGQTKPVRAIKTVSGGNDFLQLDHEDLPGQWRKQRSQFIRGICDRHFGMGADGLVVRRQVSTDAFQFRIFNRDGNEAELSGNGMAGCAAVIFAGLPGLQQVTLQTAIGPRRIVCNKHAESQYQMTVEIGPADFHNHSLFPFLNSTESRHTYMDMDFYPVSVGNPHAVCLVAPDTRDREMTARGKRLQASPLFPQGVNVEVVRPGASKSQWQACFIERGAGETRSSSTGCAAVFAVLRQQRLINETAIIESCAGSSIEVSGHLGSIKVENTTRIVYKGEYVPFRQSH